MIRSTQRMNGLLKTKRSNINFSQIRTTLYNRYKHGPTKILNPELTAEDYKRWLREFFGRKGWEDVKERFIRVYQNKIVRQAKTAYYPNTLYPFEHFDNDTFLQKWRVKADSDSLHGFSHGQLIRSRSGHALFKGVIDNRRPDDGITENSGFVAMIGPPAPLTDFYHVYETRYDWTPFNTFEIKFRGDGRKYLVVLNCATYSSDIQFYDVFSYPLYTRGGPYWQTVRIPFSKFMFNVKGCLQDHQIHLPTQRVKFVAIALHDRADGPFALEIDYMGLRKDCYAISEDIPYEQYSFAHIKFKQLSLGCDPPER